MSKEPIILPFQTIARLAVNRALFEHFPQIILEKSASYNGGFYSVIRFDSPLSHGYEKELERFAKAHLKKSLDQIEEIEMEKEGGCAYFEKEHREAEAAFVDRGSSGTFEALRWGRYIDPWPSSSIGKESPKSIELNLFKPEEVSKEILEGLGLSTLPKKKLKMPRQIIFGLAAEGKKELKELLRQKSTIATGSHSIKGKNLYVFDSHLNMIGYSAEGTSQLSEMCSEAHAQAKARSFTVWKPMQNKAFNRGFIKSESIKIACVDSAKKQKDFFDRGAFAFDRENRVEIEGAVRRRDLEEKMISSLQLIETLFKLWGIEVKKELVSFPAAFAGYSALIQAISSEGVSQDVRGRGGNFALIFYALDCQGVCRRVADMHVAPAAGEKSIWHMKSKCYIDDTLAVRIETNA